MSSQLFKELGTMTKCNIKCDLSARQIWSNQELLARYDLGNFLTTEQYYRDQGPWLLTASDSLGQESFGDDTPYLAACKANLAFPLGWEELKLTRNGEL